MFYHIEFCGYTSKAKTIKTLSCIKNNLPNMKTGASRITAPTIA